MHARQADQTSLFAPVDAAAAFANLYQRWFDDPRGLARASPKAGAVRRRIVAVQTCSPHPTNAPAPTSPGAPTVLRFEGCDLRIRDAGLHIALHVGSLETDAPVAGLRWKSLRPCSYAIGRQVSDLVFCTDENGLLVELEIVLDDGGRLVVGGGRPACEHDEEAMPQAV